MLKELNKYKNLGLPIVTLNPGVVTGPRDFKTFGKTLIGISNGKIKSKFFGFTEKEISNLEKYLGDTYLKYAESIVLSKQGKLKKNLHAVILQ